MPGADLFLEVVHQHWQRYECTTSFALPEQDRSVEIILIM